MSKLVIVESPAKAKTIKKYLGKGFEVVATMGHIRDLPKSKMGVDIENDFTPEYINMRGKADTIKALKKASKDSDYVYLATDPDREGEAISWHLAYLLDLPLTQENRVTFGEITKSGVSAGMNSPRQIDIPLVDAQQARRVLDRIVGYKISPFLWRKIRPGLSAGRVQSVAVKLIVDRENAIRAFVPEEYWSIDAQFVSATAKKAFSSKYYGTDEKKVALTNKEGTDNVLNDLAGASYNVTKVKLGTRKKSPAPPFTTSTLQQEASRKLGFASYRTMNAAQELYEGVNVEDVGVTGLITYMRTDSLRVSDEARAAANEYIKSHYGAENLPEKPRFYKTKKNAQDGHEAVRPSNPALSPADVQGSLSPDLYKLYKLIWERFMASQMADQIQNTVSVEITGNGKEHKHTFKASGHSIKFAGYSILYTEGKDTSDAEDAEGTLPVLSENELLTLAKLDGNQHFTEPPARFTEATLIKTLEENGIGRPSTYAPTIGTIVKRLYVERDGRALKPTALGEVTTQLISDCFPYIVDETFTAKMEDDLDNVETGDTAWKQLIANFYGPFADSLSKADEKMQGQYMKIPDVETGEDCPNCGKPMVEKYGRFGKFIACSGYPECKTIKKNSKPTDGICPKCGKMLIERKGRGKKPKPFYGCEGYPKCDYLTNDLPLADKCPKCKKTLLKKENKSGMKIYCADVEACGYTQ